MSTKINFRRASQTPRSPLVTVASSAADDTVHTRLRSAARHVRCRLNVAQLTELGIALLWLSTLVAPPLSYAARSRAATLFGESPAAAMLCLLCASSTSLVVVVVRLASSMRVDSDGELRVDRVANAPRIGRQVAFACDDSALGWWFWSGYVLAPLVCAFNWLLLVAWLLVGSLSTLLASLVAVLSLCSTLAHVYSTRGVYSDGVQRAFSECVVPTLAARSEWAQMCAAEARERWLLLTPDTV